MSDLSALYHATILEHDERPHNYGRLPEATHTAKAHNPLCGDRIELWLRVEDGVVRAASFEARGCALSRASGSLMTEALTGLELERALRLAERFEALVGARRGGARSAPVREGETPAELDALEAAASLEERLEPLRIFGPVSAFPTRIGCAVLSWDTLRRALQNEPMAAALRFEAGLARREPVK